VYAIHGDGLRHGLQCLTKRKNSKAAAGGKTAFHLRFHTLQKNVLEFGLFVVEHLSNQISKTHGDEGSEVKH